MINSWLEAALKLFMIENNVLRSFGSLFESPISMKKLTSFFARLLMTFYLRSNF